MRKNAPSTIARKIFIVINFFVVIPALLACLTPFVPSDKAWPVAICGLIFPLLFLLLVLLLLIWLLMRSRWFLLPLLTLLISFQQIRVMFAWRAPSHFSATREPGTIRLLSWNVARWDEKNKARRGGTSYRNKMLEALKKEGADIVCLQEFFECLDPRFFESNIPAMRQMGYPYHYFFVNSTRFNNTFLYGLAIFSRYPIVDSGGTAGPGGIHSEGSCFADVRIGEKILRIFNADLESAGFTRTEYDEAQKAKAARGILGKLKQANAYRAKQAQDLQARIRSSPHPAVVCLDMNDVPNSYAYFTIRGNKRDAFLAKGSGMGRTLRFISPTLRIDHIFTDPGLELKQFRRIILPYSDHYPLVTDILF